MDQYLLSWYQKHRILPLQMERAQPTVMKMYMFTFLLNTF